MPITFFDPLPFQAIFTEDDIRAMVVGRRQLRTEWQTALYPPGEQHKNWCLILPFANTYENAFNCMCGVKSHAHHARHDRLIIFLNATEGAIQPPLAVLKWVELVSDPVAMKDFLAISFALDYDREGGDPNKAQTAIGALRAQAKPYGDGKVRSVTRRAADMLVEHCVAFLNAMDCYSSADCIVAMPPSDPSKAFNLPRYLAERIAGPWGREDLSMRVIGTPRNSIRLAPLAQKLDTLLGTIHVDDGVFVNRNILLLDDLYQSGVSMNYCGLLLLRAGAKRVLGLACEKTCRNDDNFGGRI